MKTENSEKFYKNFSTYKEYCQDYERLVKEFKERKQNRESLTRSALSGTLQGVSIGFQFFALKKTFNRLYGLILQLNLSKEKIENSNNKKQINSSENTSESKSSNQNSTNSEFSTHSPKISSTSITSEALKVTEVFENKMANSSLDSLKNGIKKALMEARAEAQLDGNGKKSKVHLSKLMDLIKDEIKTSSSKFEKEQSLAIKLAKEKIEKFITQTDPSLDAKELTKRLLLSTKWSDLESKDCLKNAAGFLQNELKRNQTAQNTVYSKTSYTNPISLNEGNVTEYNHYDNNLNQYPIHFNKQTAESPSKDKSTSENVSELVNETKYQSRDLVLEESNDPNIQKYKLTNFAKETFNGNYGDALNELLANPKVEDVLNAGRTSCKSFEESSKQNFESVKTTANESSKDFVFDNFDPYDPYDPYH